MKVILKGINPQVYANPLNDYHTKQLQQVSFPIETISYERSLAFEDDFRNLVIVDGEEWCLDWFDYEEVED